MASEAAQSETGAAASGRCGTRSVRCLDTLELVLSSAVRGAARGNSIVGCLTRVVRGIDSS